MQIEIARAADIPALSALLTLLFSQEAEFRPDEAAQQRGLAAIIAEPSIGQILLARDDSGAVIGMVSLLLSISTALGARVALLEDMVVSPQARNSGLGSQLLQAAIVQARQLGCRRITLLTDLDNLAAQRFYARHGFSGSPMTPLRLLLD